VRDSYFCENDANGLRIKSTGFVTIDNITSEGNSRNGTVINNVGGEGITVLGSNFDRNQLYGLLASSSGTIVLNGLDVIGNGLSGANLVADEIHVMNSRFNWNGQYGIVAFLNNGGTMFLWCNVNLNFNGSGEKDVTGNLALVKGGVVVFDCDVEIGPEEFGSLSLTGTLPRPVVYTVDSGELVDICGQTSSLILPNGNTVTFSQGVCDEGSLSDVEEENLPSDLPQGYNFLSSMASTVIQGGSEISVFPEGEWSILSFPIPAGYDETSNFSILYWDENANDGSGGWVEVSPMYVVNGYVTAVVTYTGVFTLATK